MPLSLHAAQKETEKQQRYLLKVKQSSDVTEGL